VWQPGKPSQNENEYFARQDAEWKAARRAQLDAERMSKQAHPPMKCPRCDGTLVERTVADAVIDVCDKCRGVWLDTGELDLLAHVSTAQMESLLHSLKVKPK
jgi:ribosomal protein L37AE/L43A